MKTINRNIDPRRSRATRSASAASVKTERRSRLSGHFEQLKNGLLEQQLEAARDTSVQSWLRRAAEEAAALAWATPYPLLLLPALLEEKSCKARLQAQRQRQVQSRSQAILALAA